MSKIIDADMIPYSSFINSDKRYALEDTIKRIPKANVVEVERLEELLWYHHGDLCMVRGGNSNDPEFEPYVKWSDIQKLIDMAEEPNG